MTVNYFVMNRPDQVNQVRKKTEGHEQDVYHFYFIFVLCGVPEREQDEIIRIEGNDHPVNEWNLCINPIKFLRRINRSPQRRGQKIYAQGDPERPIIFNR